MHAMRGISAHSNGFQACRAIHFLQVLLGSVDCPGGHLAKPPYPKHVAPKLSLGKMLFQATFGEFPARFSNKARRSCNR